MNFVCNLNIDFYRAVLSEIASDEVIITERAIEHIKKEHPGDYENYSKYFPEIITAPNYILAANKPNRAMLLKEIEVEERKLKLILQIKTSSEPAEYKNSVVTFNSISEKRYERYIRNGEILYEKAK